jgi:hypothetical protein
MNNSIFPAIASPQMRTNPVLCTFGIFVIAVVQDHELDVAEDGLNWIIVRTAFGQADPVQSKVTHDLTGLARFTRMGTILIQRNPNGIVRIPITEVT